MGAQISTVISQRLESQTIDEILQDNNVLGQLLESIPLLPLSTRAKLWNTNINPIESPQSSFQGISQSKKLRRLVHIKNVDLAIQSGKILIVGYRIGLCFEAVSFREYQWRSTSLEVSHPFFHDLRNLFAGSGDNKEIALDNIISIVKVGAPCPFVDSQQDMSENVKRWANIGMRYDCLAASLNYVGCLFLLPDLGSDYI
ncbi:3f0c1253-f1ea-4f2e-9063-db9f2d4b56ab [Sclerotinia trifoliorum]|uniref:3f0c1253-f1ea-4f2e-9063-db9f2d4b56ab n=1 Tax=Sclerotinia trifoliorum TaxID=28548 RepID=A0A8H2ZJM0_9HELO|nr:3f0c1253-f1ea-4f2e-9063-db9f2d4b56ab [Sclerotinia trifoliorum]